jgi:hypothetical protein
MKGPALSAEGRTCSNPVAERGKLIVHYIAELAISAGCWNRCAKVTSSQL